MNYMIEQIQKIVGFDGQIVISAAQIELLLTDSRKINFAEKALFFAIPGAQHNGHLYIEAAFLAGVRNFIVEQLPSAQVMQKSNVIVVENCIEALQKIAAHHRRQFKIPVIGVTGSNGKTICKEWLFHILKFEFAICRNPKSYNSQIGVPLSVWQINEQHQLGIFEAGISLPNEMQKLQQIILPSVGLFTNIGPAHNEGFINTTQKIEEKALLFLHCDHVVFCVDHFSIANYYEHQTIQKITWSQLGNPAAVQINSVIIEDAATQFNLVWKEKEIALQIPFTDEASLENAIHCAVVALHFNIPLIQLQEALLHLPAISMRLELKMGVNHCLLINDVYSADIASLTIALHFLNQQAAQKRHVILTDIEGSGEVESNLYQQVAALLAENKIDEFTGIGEALMRQQFAFKNSGSMRCNFYPSIQQYLTQLNSANFHNQAILLKGARRYQLERVSQLLAQKTHGTVLHVNLNNLIHNLNSYRGQLQPGVKIMAMVKAFSYGIGTAEIASVLNFNHIDYLAVAYADEGIELRKNGIHLPMMVMNPEPATFAHLLAFNLEPELYSLRILKMFIQFLHNVIETDQQQIVLPIKIHIKLDTGMHRLGFEQQHIASLVDLLKQNPMLKVASIFSHLAAADEPKHQLFTQSQIQDFDSISQQIIAALNYPILRHLLNTPGISQFNQNQFDMVRLGIGLYGDDPSALISEKLLPVSSLFTTVAQIKTISKGESVGYGRSFIAEKLTTIATLNIGYADGFGRKLGNGKGHVFIHGQLAPVVGRVCMDMVMVDISTINKVEEGDEVEIFGDHISIQQFAEWMGTIPYEVMTGISQRVKRIYLQD